MSLPFTSQLVVAPDVMSRVVGEESVLLNLKCELYLGLDAIGTRMWTLLTNSEPIQTAFDILLAEYDVPPQQLRQDLNELIEKLIENNLVRVLPGNAALHEHA